MFTILCSSPCSASSSSAAAAITSFRWHATKLRSHECFSLNFSASSRVEVRPLVTTVGFRAPGYLLTHCSCLNSPTNLHTASGLLYSLFREVGLNQEEIEFLLLKNPSLRTTSLDKISGRILSLRSLGIEDIVFHRLVTKRPTILTAEEIDPFIRFLCGDVEEQLEPKQIERVLAATEATFLVGFDQKVRLLLRHGIPQEKITRVLNNVNLAKAFCKKSLEDIERTMNFLNPYGGADIIVRRPAILNCDLDTQLIPRIKFLLELSGGDEKATGTVLYKLPAILSYRVGHLHSQVEFLRSFAGLSYDQIFKIVQVFPNMISVSKERKLRPRIEFLKQCGLDSNDICKFLTKAPLFLALSFEENLVHKLGFLVKIGYEYRTKEFTMALGAVTRTSRENMQKVIGLFFSYGLSCVEILTMSKKHPQVLQYNPSSLQEKMEYLIDEMGREVEELLVFPAFLGYKLNERIKHRYEVKRNIRGENMSLNKLLAVSTERFSTKKKREIPAHDPQLE